MLAPDLMHELELGVWKALFTHLVRVLYAAAADGSLVRELDARYEPAWHQQSMGFLSEMTSLPCQTDFGKYQPLVVIRFETSQTTPQK